MSLTAEEITAAGAAFAKGRNLLKFCEAGADLAEKYAALDQLVAQRTAALDQLDKDTDKTKDDHAAALEALEATRAETLRTTQEAEQARQIIIREAGKEADALIEAAAARAEKSEQAKSAIDKDITLLSGIKADLEADIARLNKEKADSLARITGALGNVTP